MESDFKIFVREQIDRHPFITPSACVLLSFYVMDINKPPTITVKLFSWLRSIAEKEIQIYKGQTQ